MHISKTNSEESDDSSIRYEENNERRRLEQTDTKEAPNWGKFPSGMCLKDVFGYVAYQKVYTHGCGQIKTRKKR